MGLVTCCWKNSLLTTRPILRTSLGHARIDMDSTEIDFVSTVVEVHNIDGNGVAISPTRAIQPSKLNGERNYNQPSPSPSSMTHAQDITCSAETTIRELENNESSISTVLRYCKQKILTPYLKLLGVIGLKPLCNPRADLCTCSIIFNKVWVGAITLLLLAGYSIQYLTCFRRDRGFAYKNSSLLQDDQDDDDAGFGNSCRGYAIYVHLFPSLLHFGSFLITIYLYRINHDEQLPNLLERVFINASQTHSNYFSQNKLIKTLKILIGISGCWVSLSITYQLIQMSYHDVHVLHWRNVTSAERYALIIAMIASNFWQDTIQVAVISSYCVHCYLLTTYITLIEARIQQHSLTLPECIKEVGEIDSLLKYLNSDLGPGLGPLILLDSVYSISAIAFLIDKGDSLDYSDLVTVAISAALWLVLLWFPLFRAAKLSTACVRLRELGHYVAMRPFGYQNLPQEDLDSFLLFISSLRMKVGILRIPVTASLLAICIAGISFGLLTWGLFFV